MKGRYIMSRIKKVRKTKINAFTLIELIAVLVILAVISLIVAPLLLNTIRRVKDVANKRSVDGYGRAVEYAMADYQLVHLAYPDNFDKLEIEYKGNKVECKTSRINPDYSIYLSECKVNGKLVKDDKEIDGYYHYGILKMTNQEYVDTYGKNLEDALKKYHDEHNEYPSDYTTLELPPSDKEVSCDVSINYDGTVYLTKCLVDEDEVIDENTKDNYYHYGSRKYKVGDIVAYNDINFYVLSKNSSSITLLKADPFSVDEVNMYGEGHINKYSYGSVGTAYNYNGHGYITYYTSETCGYLNGRVYENGCITDYSSSDIKYVIDSWAAEKIYFEDEYVDSTGYSVRLITEQEYEKISTEESWKYGDYIYWTMTPESTIFMYDILSDGSIGTRNVYNSYGYGLAVRPVVTLKKSALE